MVTNFEPITQELNESELKLIPALIAGFNTHSKRNPIKAPEIVTAMNKYILKNKFKMTFTQVRLRKCVNYIRSAKLIPLIATSKGYYVSYNPDDILKEVESLRQRANSIHNSADGIESFVKDPKSKGVWRYEISSGFDGHRCQVCATWVYADKPKKCKCDEAH